MGDLAGDCSAETSFARCIVWVADLTFTTVELIAVENPDDKCALAIKMCSKTKETAYQILSAYFVCREALPLELKEGSCSTQSGFFLCSFWPSWQSCSLSRERCFFFFYLARYLGSSVTVIRIILWLHEVSQEVPWRSNLCFQLPEFMKKNVTGAGFQI